MALTEMSSPDFNNAPASIGGVAVVPNQNAFWLSTETNKDAVKATSFDSPVFGRYARVELLKRGLHTMVQVLIDCSLTVDENAGTVALKDLGMHRLLERLQYRVNGTDVHGVSGIGLKLIEATDYPDMDLSTVEEGLSAVDLTTDGTYEFTLAFLVPVGKDQGTDIGGLLAESDGTSIELIATMAAKEDVFTLTGAADVTLTATMRGELTFRELQRDYVNGQPVIYVPDLSRVHMIYETTKDVVSTGTEDSPVLRANGNLHRVIGWIRNNGAQMDPRTLDFIAFGYGGNQFPRRHQPAHHKLLEDALHYRDVLPYKAWAFDFDSENPVRDATRPRSVTQMVMQAGIPSGTSLTAAKFHAVQQSIISAKGSTAIVQPDSRI